MRGISSAIISPKTHEGLSSSDALLTNVRSQMALGLTSEPRLVRTAEESVLLVALLFKSSGQQHVWLSIDTIPCLM